MSVADDPHHERETVIGPLKPSRYKDTRGRL